LSWCSWPIFNRNPPRGIKLLPNFGYCERTISGFRLSTVETTEKPKGKTIVKITVETGNKGVNNTLFGVTY
jgi:hypothetical protein